MSPIRHSTRLEGSEAEAYLRFVSLSWIISSSYLERWNLLQRGLMGLKVGYAMAFAIRWDSIAAFLLEDGYDIRTIQDCWVIKKWRRRWSILTC